MASTTNTPNTLIKLPEVKRRTTLSTSEIYRRLEAGTFPQQIRLGAKAVAWLEHEIDTWISEAVEQSRPASSSVEA
ncbi:MAG: AlpA family transcriptional regulator [Pseudomonas sp.]|nr:AlpA family transcriptional regulator [Pseudomonas sp.]